MLCSILVLLSVLLSIAVSNPIYNGRDVGSVTQDSGRFVVTGQTEFPFMARLTIFHIVLVEGKPTRAASYCGGIILNAEAILTAAHCITEALPKPRIYVKAGMVNWRLEKGHSSWMKSYVIHENYVRECKVGVDKKLFCSKDLAIIWLWDKLPLNGATLKSAVLVTDTSSFVGTNGWILGWGLNSYLNAPAMLQKGLTSILSFEDCSEHHSNILLDNGILCLLSPDRRVTGCSGDSGGPFVVNGVVYGILSFSYHYKYNGKEYCSPRHAEVGIHLGWYKVWIEQTLLEGPESMKAKQSVPPPTRAPLGKRRADCVELGPSKKIEM